MFLFSSVDALSPIIRPSKTEGLAAITGLKGKALKERTLDVNEARPRVDKKGGSPYGGQRGGGSGGRGKPRRY